MKATRNASLCLLGLLLIACTVDARGSDPPSVSRPDPHELPSFRAPDEPPPDPVPEEPSVVEPDGPLSLRDAWSLALLHSPDLATFSWEARASEARTLQAKKPRNPELEIRLTRLGATDRTGFLEDVSRRLFVRQEFELGGKRAKRTELAQAEHDRAEWDYVTRRDEVAAQVAVRFVALLGAQLRVETLESWLAFVERTGRQVAKLVETGAVRGLEIHRGRREAARVRLDLEEARTERDAARSALAATWGNPTPRFSEAVGDLERLSVLPDLETILDIARWSPTLGRSDSDLERSRAALRLSKSGRVPDLTVGAGVRWDDNFTGRDYLLEFEFDLPLFDRKQGDVLAGRNDVARAQAARDAAEAAMVSSVSELYHRARGAGARAATVRDELLPATRAALDVVRLGFESNAETPDNLLDARRDVARAEIDYVETLVEHQQLLALLEGMLGQPIPE